SALGSAIRHQQPARVAVSILQDSVRLFAVTREPSLWVVPISRWQFQTSYPTYPPWVSLGRGNVIIVRVPHRALARLRFRPRNPPAGGGAGVDRPIAAFLRSSQLGGGSPPGPLLALFCLTGLAGSLLLLPRRGREGRGGQLALACLLFTSTAVVVLFAPDVYEFSWRYQLPAVITPVPPRAPRISALLRPGHPQPRRRKPLVSRPS